MSEPSRRRRHLALWPGLLLLALATALLLPVGRSAAAPATQAVAVVSAERLDVALAVQPSGDVQVTETWRYAFNTTSPIGHGFRTIPLGRLDGVTNVTVREEDQAYTRLQQGQGRRPGAFAVGTNDAGQIQIDWYFNDVTGRATRTWTIGYLAKGAVRQYDQGDQLWWTVVSSLDYAVQGGQVTVTLPQPVAADALKLAAYPSNAATASVADPRTVQFALAVIPPGRATDVRVQFPHGSITGPKPAWQAGVDQQTYLQDEISPVITLFMLLLGLGLIPVLGLVGLLYLYWTRGRDPAVGAVPNVLTTPPSRLPAGMVGTLIDERADPSDVLATLADLGERGVIRLAEVEDRSLVGSTRDFEIERLPLPAGERLRPYEQTLLDTLFAAETTVRLSRAKLRFFPAVPRFAAQLEAAVAAEGLTNGNPSQVRGRYRGLAVALIVVSVIGAVLSLMFLSWLTPAVALPFASTAVIGFVLAMLAPRMVSRTRAGALEAARWRAFRTYLAGLPQTSRAETPAASRYLPYAVALGLDRDWVARLGSVGMPAPPWFRPLDQSGQPAWGGPWGPGSPASGYPGGPAGPWGPGPYGGPWGGGPVIITPGGHGHHHGQGGGWGTPGQPPGGQATDPNRPSTPDEASERAGRGFDDASESLARMFDTASELFAGRGGGGWSGGGGGGGGGSGGGGGGFSRFVDDSTMGGPWGGGSDSRDSGSTWDSGSGGASWDSASSGGWDSGSSSGGGGFDNGGGSGDSGGGGGDSGSSSSSE